MALTLQAQMECCQGDKHSPRRKGFDFVTRYPNYISPQRAMSENWWIHMPQRSDFPSDIDFARAMQRWAAEEVPASNPQRRICIDDWFAEELLLIVEALTGQAQTANGNCAPADSSPKKEL